MKWTKVVWVALISFRFALETRQITSAKDAKVLEWRMLLRKIAITAGTAPGLHCMAWQPRRSRPDVRDFLQIHFPVINLGLASCFVSRINDENDNYNDIRGIVLWCHNESMANAMAKMSIIHSRMRHQFVWSRPLPYSILLLLTFCRRHKPAPPSPICPSHWIV